MGIKLIGFIVATFLKATTCLKTYSMCWAMSLWKHVHEEAIKKGLLSNIETLNVKEDGIYTAVCLGIASNVEVRYNNLGMLTSLNSSNYVACGENFINSTNILIARYSNCQNPFDASKLFNMMTHIYTVTWNALIDGYVQIRFTDEVVCCLFKFIPAELKLELIVYVGKWKNAQLNFMRLRKVDHEKSWETTFISLTAMWDDKFEEISYKAWKVTVLLCQHFIFDGCTILVHGFSRVVLEVLRLDALNKKLFRVFCTEGRSDQAILRLSNELAKLVVPMKLMIEYAVAYTMDKVDMVFVGVAEVVESGGIIKLMWTCQVVMVTTCMNKPICVAADSYKIACLYHLDQKDWAPVLQPVVFCVRSPSKDEVECSARNYIPQYLTLHFTDVGVLTPSVVSDISTSMMFMSQQ